MTKCSGEGCNETLRRSERLNKLYDRRECANCCRRKNRKRGKKQEEQILYPTGLIIKDTAVRPDKETPYTMIGFKYMENDIVFLTTTDSSNTYSKRLERKEVNALKAWLATGDYEGVFDNIEDGIYVHRARSMPGRLHVRDKITGGYVYTYVPEGFFTRV